MSKLVIVSHFQLNFEKNDTHESIVDEAIVLSKLNKGNTKIKYRNYDILVSPHSNRELLLDQFNKIDLVHSEFQKNNPKLFNSNK